MDLSSAMLCNSTLFSVRYQISQQSNQGDSFTACVALRCSFCRSTPQGSLGHYSTPGFTGSCLHSPGNHLSRLHPAQLLLTLSIQLQQYAFDSTNTVTDTETATDTDTDTDTVTVAYIKNSSINFMHLQHFGIAVLVAWLAQ